MEFINTVAWFLSSILIPILVLIAVVAGMLYIAKKDFKLFIILILPFLIAFVSPMIIGKIIHSFVYLPPASGSGIPLPGNYVDLSILLYYMLPIPFSIPTVITILLISNFKKRLFKEKKH